MRSYPSLATAVVASASWALVLLLPGCSFSQLPRAECTENADCRETFGRGWTCGEAGYCSEAPVPARCNSFPEAVLEDLSDHEDDILLGNIFDFGDFFGMQKSARLAVIQVNTRDGLFGTQYGMVECTNAADFDGDGLDENTATADMAAYMADVLGIRAIVGPATSTRAEIAYNTSAPLDTLHISPSATSPGLTSIDGVTSTTEEPGLFWRTAPPDSLQGKVIALEVMAADVDRVGVVAQVGAYGEGLAEVFQSEFDGEGRTSELKTYSDVSELGSIAADYNSGEYGAVLMISSITAEIADFMNAAGSLGGYDSKLIFLPDGAFDIQLIDESENLAEHLYPNVRGTVPATPAGLAFNTFVASYQSVYDEDPTVLPFTAQAYDAGWLAIAGTAWSSLQEGEVTGTGAARGLRKISGGDEFNTGPNDWNNVKAAFSDGDSVDLSGASGSLDYDPLTGETAAPVNVWVIIEDGTSWTLSILYCVDVSPSPSQDCEDPGGPEEL